MKSWFAIFVVIILASSVSSLSSTLGESYSTRETMIGQLSQDIIDIDQANANVLKDEHITVGFNGEIKKLGESYYVWLPAPQNPGNYTLVVEDVIASVDGFPEIVTFEHNFVVDNETDYSISPGLILSSSDFEIDATLYEDFSKTINVDYPSNRDVTLNPLSNTIDFSIGEFVGTQFVTINLGKYAVPAFLVGEAYICGDGAVDNVEVCDGSNLGGESCVSKGFDQGTLGCASSCLVFDTGNCEDVEGLECGPDHLELCLGESNCTDVSGFWYENLCNRYEEGAECDSEHVTLCNTIGTCFDVGGFWYDGVCNEEAGPECDEDNLDLCLTFGACYDVNGYWYNDECNEEDKIENRFYVAPQFEIAPKLIRSTAFIGAGPPKYNFGISNTGERNIEELYLEYKTSEFVVQPERIFDLGPNETADFTLEFLETSSTPVRGALIAYADNVSDHLLFEVEFTNNENEAGTDFSGGDGNGGYYCSELNGRGCAGDEVCEGELKRSIDKTACCVGICEAPSGSSKTWIGYLLAGILILILLIVYVKYKKTGKSPNPTAKRFASAEKNLP